MPPTRESVRSASSTVRRPTGIAHALARAVRAAMRLRQRHRGGHKRRPLRRTSRCVSWRARAPSAAALPTNSTPAMISLNLNPAQAARARPQSASLRTPRGQTGDPSFNRLRNEGQATPRLAPKPDVTPGEEEPWLFAFARSLNTMDVWKMGFSRVICFGAHHWVDEATAAAEISEVRPSQLQSHSCLCRATAHPRSCAPTPAQAFRASTPLTNLSAESKEPLESIIAPCFLRGDVLLAVQCTQLGLLPPEEQAACIKIVAKFVDCISNVWSQYDEMEDPELGAVVVVLEGYTEAALTAEWAPDDSMTYPVAPLDEELTVFFK